MLPPTAVWPLAAGLGEALVAIHAAGVAHLDLKPSNVLLTADGPRVIDFGISRPSGEISGPTLPAGSPGFMSPEQVGGRALGPASDVFSLGSTLAYACTAMEPFGEGPPHVKMFRIDHEVPPLVGIADENLRIFLANCMIREPAGRPTAVQLTSYLASVTRSSGSSWLPPAVVTEIDRRASEAQNPPVERAIGPRMAVEMPPRRRMSRRALLFGGIGGAVVLAAGIGVPTLYALDTKPKPAPTPKPTPKPTASPAAVHTLEFYFTGNVALTSVTYTVNGQAMTLKNVRLPWRQVVKLPSGKGKNTWQLTYGFPPGEIQHRVLVDGFQVTTGVDGVSGQQGSGKDSGYTYT
ncbi:protein kinase domain-containing protein [Fodinicola feengrottensis]|uniref:protein kinase domain-containing protein n=1 Tax=Fodinicola feengrottensis TaxID=435914 RepID=UPI0013D39450|nr:protein kinase [Fodinicola feengrottensis]